MADTVWRNATGIYLTDNNYLDSNKVITISEHKGIDNIEDIPPVLVGENYSEAITFEMNRYKDAIDLSALQIQILFQIDKTLSAKSVYNVKVSDDKIRFMWIVDGDVTQLPIVPFSILVTGTVDGNPFVWKSFPSNLNLKVGFDQNDIKPIKSNSWYTDFTLQMQNYTEQGNTIKKDIQEMYDELDTQIANITENTSDLAEVVNARSNYKTLGKRLSAIDETTSKLDRTKVNKDEVTNVLTPKGNLQYASLPATGNTVGWYYYCPDGDGTNGKGNYVWNGTTWYFGGTGDEGYSKLKNDLGKLNSYIFKDDIDLKTNVANYKKSEGWKLVGDGTRKAESTSEIIGYKVTAGQLLHIKLSRHTSCVYHFATAFEFGTEYIVGESVYSATDSIITVPENATWLLVSEKLADTTNKIYTVDVLLDIVQEQIGNINSIHEDRASITYEKGANRFNSSKDHFLDDYYVTQGNYVPLSGYFVTHLMEVEPNTTYYKNENADGIYYDKNCKIIGLTSGKQFTTPNNCKYYRTSCTNGIAPRFYVSTVDGISAFTDVPELTQDAEKAVKKVISSSKDIKTEIQSVSSEYVNTTQARNRAVITFIDDDGRADVYTRLLPIIRAKNIKYGFAIVSQYIGSNDCMTLDQLKECHDTGLVETLSHTYTLNSSLVGLTEAELDYQFSMSKQWLRENGFENYGLVYPTNNSDELVRHVARQYYDYCFTGTHFNDKGYLDHSLIERVAFGSFTTTNPTITGISNTDTIEYYKACVDKAIANGEWLIFMTHIADQKGTEDAVLEVLVNYIREKGIEILFPSEAFALKRNQVNIGDSSDKYLFVGNKNYATNIVGYQYRLRDEISGGGIASQPVTVFPPNAVTITYFNSSANAGYPTSAGTLETFYCKTSPDFSWQKWTAHPTCKQKMRFWDNTNKVWLDWVAIN